MENNNMPEPVLIVSNMDMSSIYEKVSKICLVNNISCPAIMVFDSLPENKLAFCCKTEEEQCVLGLHRSIQADELEYIMLNLPDIESVEVVRADSIAKSDQYSYFYYYAYVVSSILNVPCPQLLLNNDVPEPIAGVLRCQDDQTMKYGRPYKIFLRNLDIDIGIKPLIHEMRHVWQHYKDEEKYCSGYSACSVYSTGKFDNEYYMHVAELDAEAYAIAFVVSAFGHKVEWYLSPDRREVDKIKEKLVRGYLANPKKYKMPPRFTSSQ